MHARQTVTIHETETLNIKDITAYIIDQYTQLVICGLI
jgi:hypothetical protein